MRHKTQLSILALVIATVVLGQIASAICAGRDSILPLRITSVSPDQKSKSLAKFKPMFFTENIREADFPENIKDLPPIIRGLGFFKCNLTPLEGERAMWSNVKSGRRFFKIPCLGKIAVGSADCVESWSVPIVRYSGGEFYFQSIRVVRLSVFHAFEGQKRSLCIFKVKNLLSHGFGSFLRTLGLGNCRSNQLIRLSSGRPHLIQLSLHDDQLTGENAILCDPGDRYNGGKEDRKPTSQNGFSSRPVAGTFMVIIGATLLAAVFHFSYSDNDPVGIPISIWVIIGIGRWVLVVQGGVLILIGTWLL
jgi:hypothetical protein